MILGLDISTNCTGYCVLGEGDKVLAASVIDTSKQIGWFNKAKHFRTTMGVLHDIIQQSGEGGITGIAVEDILSKFSSGKSSAKIIVGLARFNGIASYVCAELFDIEPVHINVIRARNLAGVLPSRGVNSKEYVLTNIMQQYPHIDWPRMKKKDDWSKQCFDIADAIVVAKAYRHLEVGDEQE